MSTITDFYYDMFTMWYDFDPFDGSIPDPFCYINDVEVRHRAMAISQPSEDLEHYVETLKEFRQSCVDEDDDEFVEHADKIAETYHDLIEDGIASAYGDGFYERGRIAKRYSFLYDYYMILWDDETRAAKFAVKHAEEFSSEDYTEIVADCVNRIEFVFIRHEHNSDWESYYKLGMELMSAFTKHYGEDLYENNLVEIEDRWCVFAVYDDRDPKLFVRYSYDNLNKEEE